MAQTFICKNCGIEFRGKASKKPQHCSRACRTEASIKRCQRTCQQCGKGFVVNTMTKEGKYCGQKCSGLAQRVRVLCACEQCGRTFEVKASHAHKFCSRKCNITWQHANDPTRKQRLIERGLAKSQKPTKDILQELYQSQRLETAEIGTRYGVQSQTVCAWLRHYGISARESQTRFQKGFAPVNKLPIVDKETLKYLYGDWRQTTTEIGSHFGVSGQVVGGWLRHHGIKARPPGTGLDSRGIDPPTDAELEHMIHTQRLSYRQVAEQYGVDQSAVMHWLDARGIDRPKTWHELHSNSQDVSEMQALYEEGWSLEQIGHHYGVTGGPVKVLFKENGIDVRNSGWDGGKRYEAIDACLVRSSYEQRVANWLCEHNVPYVYEPRLPFAGLGDFLANGWYIEVWGVDSPKYNARKAIKQAEYKVHGLPLIELPAYAFVASRNSLWERKLKKILEHASPT